LSGIFQSLAANRTTTKFERRKWWKTTLNKPLSVRLISIHEKAVNLNPSLKHALATDLS